MINNKYVSKSLIYISNNKYQYNNNLDINNIYLINKLENIDLINFIKEKFDIKECDDRKLKNTYYKLIKFD